MNIDRPKENKKDNYTNKWRNYFDIRCSTRIIKEETSKKITKRNCITRKKFKEIRSRSFIEAKTIGEIN